MLSWQTTNTNVILFGLTLPHSTWAHEVLHHRYVFFYISLKPFSEYVEIVCEVCILLTCGKHLHGNIISIRLKSRAHQISFPLHVLLKCMCGKDIAVPRFIRSWNCSNDVIFCVLFYAIYLSLIVMPLNVIWCIHLQDVLVLEYSVIL